MAREEANRMVKAFLQSLGENALADTGYALFNTKEGVAQISFAYDEEQKALLCHAEIHRFEPNDITAEELEAFREEEKAGTPTGWGRLEYVAETKGLYLTRAYDRPVEEKLFLREMQALGEAAERWGGDEIFGRVVERARVKTAASSTGR